VSWIRKTKSFSNCRPRQRVLVNQYLKPRRAHPHNWTPGLVFFCKRRRSSAIAVDWIPLGIPRAHARCAQADNEAQSNRAPTDRARSRDISNDSESARPVEAKIRQSKIFGVEIHSRFDTESIEIGLQPLPIEDQMEPPWPMSVRRRLTAIHGYGRKGNGPGLRIRVESRAPQMVKRKVPRTDNPWRDSDH
jgi:hypothetical protein